MKPHLLHVFATFAAGGPQVRTAQLVGALGSGWRHSIVGLDGRTEARELLPDDADARVLEAPPRGGMLRTVRRLRALIAAERPDALLTYNWGAIEGLLSGRLAGLRALLHHEDGFLPDELQRFKERRVLFRRFVLPRTFGVVVPSRKLERIALETWRLPPAKVRYVPNGVRLRDHAARDGNAALRARYGIPPDVPVVGSVGHLRPEKNPVRLVRAFALVPAAARLLVLGDGPERAAVEEAVRSLGLGARVVLAGHQPDPRPYYAAMDVFALSSDTEQMPVALLEAMASALPVASTDVGDVRSILPAPQGDFVVPLGEPGAERRLGVVLARLLADAALRLRLGAGNREAVAARYSFEGMVAAYRELYRATLRHGAPGAVTA